LVLLCHQTQVVRDKIATHLDLTILDNGAFGVDLFFPISGFVIYLSVVRLQEKGGSWQGFASRRFIRIAPLYWGFTILKLLIYVVMPSAFAHYHFTLWNAIGSFLFLPAYNHEGVPLPVLSVGWTLSYEMLFYSIVSIALFARTGVLMISALTISILAVAGLFFTPGLGGLTYLAAPIELEFLGGMVVAALYLRGWRVPTLASVCLLPIMFGLALGHPGDAAALALKPVRVLYWGVPGIVIVACVAGLEDYVRRLPRRLPLLIGDASYSLYLTHTLIVPAFGLIAVALHLSGASGCITYILASGAAALIVAVVIHRCVEVPMLDALHRRMS
jgi:exopolysaccharide production protein ExoZ